MKVRCVNAVGYRDVLREGDFYEGELKFFDAYNEVHWEIRGVRKLDGLAFEKWRFEEVKELTFKEVIANIKEGEVWESGAKAIEMFKGRILIKRKNEKKFDSYDICFSSHVKYRLKRKKYTSKEAFKAFEEGKEIESCEGWKFKKKGDKVIVTNHSGARFKESSANALFSLKEMEGDWYINE